VVAIFFSDGASNNGVFAESVNLAAIWDLPVLFVLENNDYAVSTSVAETSRTCDLYRRAVGYCVKAAPVDGNDVLAVYEKAKEAVEDCRSGRGPVLIEAKTYRHQGHHVNDPGTYMPKEKLEYFKARDPVKRGRQCLLEQAGLSEDEINALEAEIEKRMDEAIEFAKNSPEPSVEEFLEEVACY
jgi:pyruvate dehydrogenase E1 component alpha subunit